MLYDVVPMKSCHILLEIPWQFDKKSMHNGFTHKEKNFVPHPLTLTQVIEDRVEMKNKRDKEKNKEKRKKLLPTFIPVK